MSKPAPGFYFVRWPGVGRTLSRWEPAELTSRNAWRRLGAELDAITPAEIGANIFAPPFPDFTRASCNRVAHRPGGDVIAIYGMLGRELVARGYLSLEAAQRLAAELGKLAPAPA